MVIIKISPTLFTLILMVFVSILLFVILSIIENANVKKKVKTLKPMQSPYLVQRTPLALWEQLGWVRNGGEYRGYYRTKFGSFKGIIGKWRNTYTVCIIDPPSQLMLHEKWSCFTHLGKGMFRVHPTKRSSPRHVDSAIIEIQTILDEAFKMAEQSKPKGQK